MSKISLIRIDSPQQKELHLSTGQISIGRGSVLGCDDKRVSRNHGLLQVSEGGSIALVSMHTNPCFYKMQDWSSYSALKKGESQVLNHGDEFALLPHNFQYRVVITGETDILPNESGAGSEVTETEINHNNQNVKGPKIKTECEEQEITNNIYKIENSVPDSFSTTPVNRKRMLPDWLTNLSGSESLNSVVPAVSTSPTTAVARKRKGSKSSEEKLKDKKVKIEVKEEIDADLGLDTTTIVDGGSEIPSVEPTTNLHQLSDDDNDNDNKPKTGSSKDGYEAQYGDSSSTSPSGEPNQGMGTNQNTNDTPSREPCMYGATCYRKNPQHRTDFSHPGDADFTINQNLPECPFGTSCYRKNVQHRKDYKHTQPARSPPLANAAAPSTTRTRQKHTGSARDDDESEDDYDFNDPFLNDASSDDYQPTTSEDTDLDQDDDNYEESQERRRMMKEAKKFTKTKKH